MMNEFISIYSRIIGEETISVENIDDVYDSVEFLIYETNFILGCPEKLKNEVKKDGSFGPPIKPAAMNSAYEVVDSPENNEKIERSFRLE